MIVIPKERVRYETNVVKATVDTLCAAGTVKVNWTGESAVLVDELLLIRGR